MAPRAFSLLRLGLLAGAATGQDNGTASLLDVAFAAVDAALAARVAPPRPTAAPALPSTGAPTGAPTPAPTSAPMPLPTAAPAPRPTAAPAPRPSPLPSPLPSPRPSLAPVPTTPSPVAPCHVVEIGLVFDRYPDETRWEVAKGRRNSVEHPGTANVLVASPFYDRARGYAEASETHAVCLEAGRYTFAIADNSEDGMCCSNGEGRYAVTYQETGELIATGAEFGQFESVTFQIPFATPPLADEDGDGRDDRTGNVIPHVLLTPAGALPERCTPERWETTFRLHLETDDYGVETTWELRERAGTGSADGRVVADGGPYASDHVYDLMYCLRPGNYTFVFYDWQCDGLTGDALTGYYALALEGEEVYRGGTVMDRYWEEVDLEVRHPGARRPEPPPALAVGRDAGAAPVAGEPGATGARLTFTENAGGGGARGGWGPVLLALAAGAGALGWN